MESAVMNLLHKLPHLSAQAFVSGLWQGMVLVGVAAVCLRLLPRSSAAVRFVVWGFAFALAAVLPLVHLAGPNVGLVNESAVVHVGEAWAYAIAGLWAVMSAARLAQLVAQALRVRGIWLRATPVEVDGGIAEALRVGGRQAMLCTSVDVDAPSVIGFLAPRLLVPEALLPQLTATELRQIVLHECEHLRRGDDWMNLLQKIGLALFPLNPALLWMDRRLGLERELACDAGVVAATAAPFDYAHCLTRLAEHRMSRRGIALALSAWTRRPELTRRVHSLLQPMRRMTLMQARVSVAVLGLGLAGGAVAMARAPRLVAFTDAVSAPAQVAALRPVSMAAMPAGMHATEAMAFARPMQAHETLAKAVMPTRRPVRMLRMIAVPKAMPEEPMETEVRSESAKPVPVQPRLVLTMSQSMNSPAADKRMNRSAVRAFYAISTDDTITYAAVPFGNGWLIIQL